MKPYRVLVTGSRSWADIDVVRAALDVARWDAGGPMVVVHGACRTGADAIASWWVRGRQRCGNPLDISEERHPAEWRRFRSQAGPIRNAHMVALGAHVALAFIGPCRSSKCRKREPHGSHGASGCADLAEQAGIRVERWPR